MPQPTSRVRRAIRLSMTVALVAATPAALSAQAGQQHGQQHGHQANHAASHGDNHAASGWKELDAYHALMMATWHPAKDRNDLAPMRAQATAMVTSARALAASTAPAHCADPKLKTAATKLVGETQGVADLVAAKKDDATLKAALKALHDSFEVLEDGCQAPKEKKAP